MFWGGYPWQFLQNWKPKIYKHNKNPHVSETENRHRKRWTHLFFFFFFFVLSFFLSFFLSPVYWRDSVMAMALRTHPSSFFSYLLLFYFFLSTFFGNLHHPLVSHKYAPSVSVSVSVSLCVFLFLCFCWVYLLNPPDFLLFLISNHFSHDFVDHFQISV